MSKINAVPENQKTITHQCPIGSSNVTPCCGLTPFELPRDQRMTQDVEYVTCNRAPRHRFKVGDAVKLSIKNSNDTPARAVVDGMTESRALLYLTINNPPEWYMRLLRERGIFLGPGTETNLYLLRSSDGQWIDTHSLKEFTVEPDAVPPMKALSLLQPFSTLVAIRAKRYETRSWDTKHRGLVAIHASKGFPKECRALLGERRFAQVLLNQFPVPAMLPFGSIIATARIVATHTTQSIKNKLDAQELAFGDYSAGRFAWELEDVRQLATPIPCKGALQLWTVPPAVEAEIRRQTK